MFFLEAGLFVSFERFHPQGIVDVGSAQEVEFVAHQGKAAALVRRDRQRFHFPLSGEEVEDHEVVLVAVNIEAPAVFVLDPGAADALAASQYEEFRVLFLGVFLGQEDHGAAYARRVGRFAQDHLLAPVVP